MMSDFNYSEYEPLNGTWVNDIAVHLLKIRNEVLNEATISGITSQLSNLINIVSGSTCMTDVRIEHLSPSETIYITQSIVYPTPPEPHITYSYVRTSEEPTIIYTNPKIEDYYSTCCGPKRLTSTYYGCTRCVDDFLAVNQNATKYEASLQYCNRQAKINKGKIIRGI